ncbi:olfactory receptor 14A16-like [Ahaetulla prasina]|uniref:olfactory receptor 14A16-like n=1 Tax=Ahaetulla prasina TaxID=499056 RepID=UPI00264751DA|nr:olfactory receptor 14A16-like [Ahaetulla prasina]
MSNQTVSGFLLLEFTTNSELQILYFVMFLILYLGIVIANVLIISAVIFDTHLHHPMYFFLKNLAIQDIGQVSVIIPKSMINSLKNTRYISYSGCVAQVFFLISFMGSDFSLLTVMAYDRYIAICKPLHYEMVMTRTVCKQIIASTWISGLLYGLVHTAGTFENSFCSNIVNQFFCEIPHLLILSCSEWYFYEILIILLSCSLALVCFTFVILSYTKILIIVLRIPSVHGKQKVLSTCLPHLVVFSIFVSTTMFAYLKPNSNLELHLNLLFTVIYSLMPPLLNPIIYGLRNKEIGLALVKLLALNPSSENK